MDHKPIGDVRVHHSRSQMSTVKAITITIDSLLPRLKLDCDVGYDVAVKGASVVVLTYARPLAPAHPTMPAKGRVQEDEPRAIKACGLLDTALRARPCWLLPR